MTIKCRECQGEIDFKDSKNGKKYPVNVDGSFHNCRNGGAKQPEKRVTGAGVGWTNVKAVKEIGLEEVASHIISGWIILERVERMEFISKNFDGIPGQTIGRTETGNQTRSVYIVGMR